MQQGKVKSQSSQFLRYLAIMVTEEFIQKNKIDFSCTKQDSSHTVIILLNAYYQELDTGWIVDEAIHYARSTGP